MKHPQLSEKTKKWIAACVFVLFVLFCGLVGWFIGRPMLRFFDEPERFRAWVQEKGILGNFLFVCMMAFQVIVALIPGEPLEIGAGYAFGFLRGTLLSLLGIILGSIFVFLLVRRFGVKLLEVFFAREKIRSLKFLQNTQRLNRITFFVYLIPGTPKDLLAYFVGLTEMKLSTWILITSVARLPSLVTSTLSGNALGEADYRMAIIAFCVTAVISVLGLWLYRSLSVRWNRHTEQAKKG
ncbi:MAG: TVP38/TMEM64 family protein [Clostridia bacterium]|nr:TVP38/TMEM64 family protein [Clostridia bacterium]